MRKFMIILSVLLLILTTAYIVSSEGSFLIGGSSNLNKLKIDENSNLEEKDDTAKADLINAKEVFSAYDEEEDLYYISNKDIVVSHSIGTDLFMTYDEEKNIYTLLAVNGDDQKKYRFVETGLPIMNIDSVIEEGDGRKTRAHVKVFDDNNVFDEYSMKYNIRGNSSIDFPKKSYSLNSIKNIPISMMGMPKNTKYVINSLFEDEFKVRDVLSWDICSQFQDQLDNKDERHCSEMKYVEVFMDNEYLGLYGLQEYINEFKIGLEEKLGSLYETLYFIFPGKETPKPEGKYWDSAILKYSNLDYDKRWDSMIDFVDLLNTNNPISFTKRADELLDMDNFINHYLLIETLMARDNIWHNTFISQREGEKINLTPWDLDMTFGGGWKIKGDILKARTEWDFNEPLVYPCQKGQYRHHSKFFFTRLINDHETFSEDAARRYFKLRESILDKDNLIRTSDKYHNLIRDTGAFERDNKRWPEAPRIKEGKEDFISVFISDHIDVLDEHFEKLLAGEYDE